LQLPPPPVLELLGGTTGTDELLGAAELLLAALLELLAVLELLALLLLLTPAADELLAVALLELLPVLLLLTPAEELLLPPADEVLPPVDEGLGLLPAELLSPGPTGSSDEEEGRGMDEEEGGRGMEMSGQVTSVPFTDIVPAFWQSIMLPV
jgi:hypothetical protein